jgi:hypothetical protein
MIKGMAVAALAWSSLARAQAPYREDAAQLIAIAREKALSYTLSLPDFVATEIVQRYGGPSRTGFYRSPLDSLTVQLRYLHHLEEHKLLKVNGEPSRLPFEELHGLVGSGEFGGSISAIFSADSQAGFHFQKWTTVRRRPAARFVFDIDPSHSRYTLGLKVAGQGVKRVVGFHGMLEIDRETGEVLHLEYAADHIPEELRVSYATAAVDYSLSDVGGRKYWLPSGSSMELHGSDWLERNVIHFRDYRKFSADSTIDFAPAK